MFNNYTKGVILSLILGTAGYAQEDTNQTTGQNTETSVQTTRVVQAQPQQTEPLQYKATEGFTLDVGFTPFGNNLIQMNAINVRYFWKPDIALRLGLGFEIDRTVNDNLLSGDSLYITKEKTMLFSLRPGIEKHFAGTDRLSPYVGAEVIFEMFRASMDEEDGSVVSELSGATDLNLANRKYTRIGLGVTAGANYYIAKNLYLGAEVGFGFSTLTYGEVSYTSGNTTTVVSDGKSTELHLGQTFKPMLLLGWKF